MNGIDWIEKILRIVDDRRKSIQKNRNDDLKNDDLKNDDLKNDDLKNDG